MLPPGWYMHTIGKQLLNFMVGYIAFQIRLIRRSVKNLKWGKVTWIKWITTVGCVVVVSIWPPPPDEAQKENMHDERKMIGLWRWRGTDQLWNSCTAIHPYLGMCVFSWVGPCCPYPSNQRIHFESNAKQDRCCHLDRKEPCLVHQLKDKDHGICSIHDSWGLGQPNHWLLAVAPLEVGEKGNR